MVLGGRVAGEHILSNGLRLGIAHRDLSLENILLSGSGPGLVGQDLQGAGIVQVIGFLFTFFPGNPLRCPYLESC